MKKCAEVLIHGTIYGLIAAAFAIYITENMRATAFDAAAATVTVLRDSCGILN